jgi:hypothetical protein
MTAPQKSETPLAGGVTQRTYKNASLHFAALAAKFKAKGHELHHLTDGRYLAARWGLSRELPTLDDAEAFLHQIGGAA